MAYLPKNIYTKKTAGKGEFMLKRNSKPFVGTYMELSDGTFQSGTIYGKGELLVPVRKTKNPGTYKVNNTGLHLDITNTNTITASSLNSVNVIKKIINLFRVG